MNQNKNQNQDRKGQQNVDDDRNRDKHASQGHQGSTQQHMNSGSSGSKTAGDQNRNPQR